MSIFKKFACAAELNFPDKEKREQFSKSLSQLVTILFSVVFGIGLSQVKELKSAFDGFVLVLAYVAVLCSWWGYHWGTIIGPKETNVLNYIVDCGLVILYWFLINIRTPFWWVLAGYVLMFGLYWVWESIRLCKIDRSLHEQNSIRKAFITNLVFFIITLFLFDSYFTFKLFGTNIIRQEYYIAFLYIVVILYRVRLHYIYAPEKQVVIPTIIQIDNTDKILVEKAKDAAKYAKVHLSGFAVGAAIMSDTDKIFVGCNIEFDNYSNTIHAEESAISAFITAGEKRPVSIAIFTLGNEVSFPCGMCRQSLFELGGKDLRVIACNNTTYEIKTMGKLLPSGFRLSEKT